MKYLVTLCRRIQCHVPVLEEEVDGVLGDFGIFQTYVTVIGVIGKISYLNNDLC